LTEKDRDSPVFFFPQTTEIEIDLDKLETATLRHLDRMVREAHSKKKKRA